MSSGKREKIVVACVVFEVSKVVRPVIEYDASRVHLIHYTDMSRDVGRIYQDFYDEVSSQIIDYSKSKEKYSKKIEIVEHSEYKAGDFQKMLMTVLHILHDEKAKNADSEIYVNISSGTAEYTAAATIASMMIPGIIPFSVGTEEYITNNEELKRVYYENGKPVGLTRLAREARALPSYRVSIPEEHLVRGLREFNKLGRSVSSAKIADVLIREELWIDNKYEKIGGRKTDDKQSKVMRYRRNFLDRWVKYGWVEQSSLSKKYILTEEGKTAIDTFYVDDIRKSG